MLNFVCNTEEKMLIKTPPKGMRDILPADLKLRQQILDVITKIYNSYGFTQIETPCVEDINTLTSKQGGDNEKLIFKILKRGEKLENASADNICDLGLRYDLTVPLSRYYANNSGNLPNVFKAIQIGNVWRAERPQKGRFRQFVQCDIDIIGEESHLAEAELISATTTALNALGLDGFTVKINDRRILKGLAQKAGFAEEDFDKVFIALDKLDKIGFDGVVGELVEEGLDEEKAKTVLNFALSISAEGLEKAKEVLKDVVDEKVFDNLAEIIAINSCDKFKLKFDCTLVRGMNYYTGPIFEIEVDGFGVSVAGGGRYDNMLGKFLNRSVPACGFSIGFERIFTVLKEKGVTFGEQPKKTAYVVDSRCGADIISKVFKEAEKIRSQGGICLVTKRIKNFGFLLEQLKKDGYSDIFQVNEKGEIRITD